MTSRGKCLRLVIIMVMTGTVMITGCAEPEDGAALMRARAAAGAGDWATALAEAKRHTLANPEDSAGHFLMGQAYLYGEKPNLAHARGEIHMALELFHRNQAWGAFQEEGMPAEEYELALHKYMARVHLRWIGEAMAQRIAPDIILERIALCRQNVGRGRKLAPDDGQFRDLEVSLNDLESILSQSRGTPSRPVPSQGVA